MGDGGKGSAPRPFSVTSDQFEQNWNQIFNKPKKTELEKFEESILKNEYYDLGDDDDRD